jgi:hypothetical protein
MQVLGMLPRKPKKEKDKDKDKDKDKKEDAAIKDKDNVTPMDSGSVKQFADRYKPKKLTLTKSAQSALINKVSTPVDDPDDPYAFNDAAPEMSPASASGGMGGMSSVLSDISSRSPHTSALPSPSRSLSDSLTIGMGGIGISKAKLYPELAEKLEKVRHTPEAKTSKARSRSSRTMNKLQTKIAQNKIAQNKLRKSQELSQSVEHSPSSVASPERMAAALLNASLSSGAGDMSHLLGADSAATLGVAASQLQQLKVSGLVPGLAGVDAAAGSGDAGLHSHLLGLDRGHVTGMMSPQHSLPPPYPGLPREAGFSPQHHMGGHAVGNKVPVTSLSSQTPLSPYMSFSQASFSSPVVSPAQTHHHALHQGSPLQHHPALSRQLSSSSHLAPVSVSWPSPYGTPVPMDSSDSSSYSFSPHHHQPVLNQSLPFSRQASLEKVVSGYPQTSALLSVKHPYPHRQTLNPNVSQAPISLGLPPPPPYIPRVLPFPVPTSVPAGSSVLVTRVHRPRGVLTEKEAKARLKDEVAVKLYGMYVHRRLSNHVFVEPSMSEYCLLCHAVSFPFHSILSIYIFTKRKKTTYKRTKIP